jgi:UDP-hydrolysing UDP-N-acetyl-D-glucosamine 2-epimerase
MSGRRRICVVSGTRADYGLLHWLMRDLRDDHAVELQLAVTGMHLSPEFGLTYRVAEADGFEIAAKVEMLLSGDTPVAVAKSMGLATIGFGEAFDRLQPDLLVVLGDRFEILAAAQAAMLARIPIAHIHGGEATEGAIDDAIRHALTKMAHLHFTAAEPYRQRVIQLGEHPDRVFNVGAPGLDNICRFTLLTREKLECELGISSGRPLFAVTYHPVTLQNQDPSVPMAELLSALDRFPSAVMVLTGANADPRGRIINEMIDDFVARRPGRAVAARSLGPLRYLSLLRHADCVIGNSSSGILEAPAIGKPTVNIGNRQNGRLRAASVIDAEEETDKIEAAIRQALTSEFQAATARCLTPFGDGHASERISKVLVSHPLDNLIHKRFFDLDLRRHAL